MASTSAIIVAKVNLRGYDPPGCGCRDRDHSMVDPSHDGMGMMFEVGMKVWGALWPAPWVRGGGGQQTRRGGNRSDDSNLFYPTHTFYIGCPAVYCIRRAPNP